jgi:hypothetical protein
MTFEYLHFDFDGRYADVIVDFFLRNTSDAAARLRFLHRGNLDFQDCSAQWLDDEVLCPVAIHLLRTLGDAHVNRDRRAVAVKAAAGAVREYVVPTGDEPLARLDPCPEGAGYVPFSLYKARIVEPETAVVLRVRARLEGRSYDRLLLGPDYESRRYPPCHIAIYGGDVIIRSLQREDFGYQPEPVTDVLLDYNIVRYAELLDEFDRQHKAPPSPYHVVVMRRPGERLLHVVPVTPDLNHGCSNLRIAGHFVTWYWACSSAFYVDGQLNGLRMTVEVDDEPSVARGFARLGRAPRHARS